MTHPYFEGSAHASDYAKFRPQTPEIVVSWIMKYLADKCPQDGKEKTFAQAADIGCGTGQCTMMLVNHFDKVTGFDVADSQIKQANADNIYCNISYQVSPAEQLPLKSESVNLLTCAQCFHWFDFEAFFTEARRVLKPNGVLALITYIRPLIAHSSLKHLIRDAFNNDPLNKYVAKQLEIVDNGYADVAIPFADVTRMQTTLVTDGASGDDILGYIRSWSSYGLCEKHEPQRAVQLTVDIERKIREQTGADMSDKQFTLETPFFLILARK